MQLQQAKTSGQEFIANKIKNSSRFACSLFGLSLVPLYTGTFFCSFHLSLHFYSLSFHPTHFSFLSLWGSCKIVLELWDLCPLCPMISPRIIIFQVSSRKPMQHGLMCKLTPIITNWRHSLRENHQDIQPGAIHHPNPKASCL